MGPIFELIGNVGFPIAVAVFLLVRIEKKLDDVNKTLINMLERINVILSGDRCGRQ